jgi:pyruvate/2-oxoglutarate/acetoin dehydrogenase E1 component
MWVLQMTVREALSTAIDEEMSADSKVLVLGEEVLGVFHL